MNQVCVDAISAADRHEAAVPLLQEVYQPSVGAPTKSRNRAATSAQVSNIIWSVITAVPAARLASLSGVLVCACLDVLKRC